MRLRKYQRIIISSLTHGKTKSCGCLKIKDLTGQRFGMLTVLSKSEKRNNYWVCRCDCGNTIEYLDRKLTAGVIESCGCVQSDLADLTGRRVGKLNILRDSEQKKDYWICQCDCGNQKEIKGRILPPQPNFLIAKRVASYASQLASFFKAYVSKSVIRVVARPTKAYHFIAALARPVRCHRSFGYAYRFSSCA